MDIPAIYHQFINWIGDGTGLPDAILHIHAGMVVLILARITTGRSLGTFLPLSIVALAEFCNEALDRMYFGSWRWTDTIGDAVNTLLWPTVICLAVLVRPIMVSTTRVPKRSLL